MAKHTLKIMRCSHRNVFKVCLAIFQHYEIKGQENLQILTTEQTSIMVTNFNSFMTEVPII